MTPLSLLAALLLAPLTLPVLAYYRVPIPGRPRPWWRPLRASGDPWKG